MFVGPHDMAAEKAYSIIAYWAGNFLLEMTLFDLLRPSPQQSTDMPCPIWYECWNVTRPLLPGNLKHGKIGFKLVKFGFS